MCPIQNDPIDHAEPTPLAVAGVASIPQKRTLCPIQWTLPHRCQNGRVVCHCGTVDVRSGRERAKMAWVCQIDAVVSEWQCAGHMLAAPLPPWQGGGRRPPGVAEKAPGVPRGCDGAPPGCQESPPCDDAPQIDRCSLAPSLYYVPQLDRPNPAASPVVAVGCATMTVGLRSPCWAHVRRVWSRDGDVSGDASGDTPDACPVVTIGWGPLEPVPALFFGVRYPRAPIRQNGSRLARCPPRA